MKAAVLIHGTCRRQLLVVEQSIQHQRRSRAAVALPHHDDRAALQGRVAIEEADDDADDVRGVAIEIIPTLGWVPLASASGYENPVPGASMYSRLANAAQLVGSATIGWLPATAGSSVQGAVLKLNRQAEVADPGPPLKKTANGLLAGEVVAGWNEYQTRCVGLTRDWLSAT